MGMKFTVSVAGTATFEDLDASDIGIDADSLIESETGWSGSVSYEDAEVTGGTVTVSARATLNDVEVSASDISDYDAEQALSEAIDSYNVSIGDADFTIDDSPTGFEEVEAAIGRESALEAYAVLDRAGFEVS